MVDCSRIWVVFGVLFVVGAGSIRAGEGDFSGWEEVTPADRALAVRAARVRATRNLVERIGRLVLADGSLLAERLKGRVEDSRLAEVLTRGILFERPEFFPSGVVRVRGRIPAERVQENLWSLGEALPPGMTRKELRQIVGDDSVEATGLGMPRTTDLRPPPTRQVSPPRRNEGLDLQREAPRSRPSLFREEPRSCPGWREELEARGWHVTPLSNSTTETIEGGECPGSNPGDRWETVEESSRWRFLPDPAR